MRSLKHLLSLVVARSLLGDDVKDDTVVSIEGDLSELQGGIETLRSLYLAHRYIQRARGDAGDGARYSWKTLTVNDTISFTVNIPKGRLK